MKEQLMLAVSDTHRLTQGIVGTIETDAPHQRKPIVRYFLHERAGDD